VITTVGAYALQELLPFISEEELAPISRLVYAPVIQVCVGVRNAGALRMPAFGGLVPSKENKQVLGILFPSECFEGRAPEGGALYSYFMGGVRHAAYMQKSDEEIRQMVLEAFHQMLKYPAEMEPDMIRIFRHERAIPQYYADSGERLRAVESLQKRYPGLVLAGNLRDGIGMGNRICQAAKIAASL
jgi:oxygen-dependent protoporphyrinogen oxidase